MPRLPLKPMKIISAVREARDNGSGPEHLLVTGSDRQAVVAVFEALIMGAADNQQTCFMDVYAGGEGEPLPPLTHLGEGDVVVMVVSPQEIDSESFNQRLSEIGRADAAAVVVMTESPGVQISFPGVGPRRVVGMAPGGKPPADVLAEAVVEAAGDAAVALAARLPVIREEACRQLIKRTSTQNAVVGCLFIIPGADMPVMTANEARMVMRIAAAHGEAVGSERAIELMGVIGSGFAFRSIARQLLDFMPGPGWVVKGGVAYGGTRAIGTAAKAYFDGSARVTPSRFAPLVERLKRLRG